MGKTIHASNYFEASRGEFKKLPSRITELFLNSIEQDVWYAGKLWKFNFKSMSSFYWTTKGALIRVSDHWSTGVITNACGWIRRCWWDLTSKSHSLKEGKVGEFYSGVIEFKNMTPVVRP